MRFAYFVTLGLLGLGAGAAAVVACKSSSPSAPALTDAGAPAFALDTPMRPLRVAMITTETLYHHPSAHMRDADMARFLRTRGHEVTVTSDVGAFIGSLSTMDVALFFVTSGELFDAGQRATFETFIRSGHGFVGVHTNATENSSVFFSQLVGANFQGHATGAIQVTDASLIVEDPNDLTVTFLPRPFGHRDEWHYFTSNPANNPALHVLLSIDESTLPAGYPDAGLYGKHYSTWKQTYVGGRSFFSALGHEAPAFDANVFEMIARGVEWAGAPSSSDVVRADGCAVPTGATVGAAKLRTGVLCTRYPWPLAGVRDVVQAKNGAVYVTELKAKRVSRLGPSGFTSVVESLANPIGIREAPDGTLLVAQEAGHAIETIDPASGARTPFASNLDNVTHIAFGPDGALYASTFPNFGGPPAGQVRRIDPAAPGTPTPFATGVFVPEGLAFEEGTGKLVLATQGAAAAMPILFRFPATGGDVAAAETLVSGSGPLFGVAPRPGGGVYYAVGERVVERRADGTTEDVVSGLAAPGGVFVTSDGDLLVIETVATNTADGYLLRLRFR